MGYETHYRVSDRGNVQRICAGTNSRPFVNLRPGSVAGYQVLVLWREGKGKTVRVHRLVTQAFLGPEPDKHEVNHINGNRGDNRLENLEYVTRQQNIQHAQTFLPRKPTSLHGTMVPNAKLDAEKVRSIKRRLAAGDRQTEIAKDFGVVKQVVWGIAKGRWWKWVD